MKRLAITLSVCLALVGWATTGHAKRGGGSKTAAPAAEDSAGGEGGEKAAPAEGAGKEGAPASESLDTTDEQVTKIEEDITGPKAQRPTTTLSWQDIVVVPRKAFLKGGRFEFAPFSGVSVNDNLIRHYAFGGEITFFLSDVFSIGVQGQYFVKAFTPTEENVGLQYNRIPTLNRYLYGGALNFGYVPVYGKFALFNKQIMHWEIFASGGVGITVSEIIPRNPGDTTWKNNLLTPNLALGSRFFLFNWLTVNFVLRDYIFPDKFEPADRAANPQWTTADAQNNASTAWVNNVMFYAGVGIYLPAKFTYKTPR
jgi:outer membrane beta-barrel protein